MDSDNDECGRAGGGVGRKKRGFVQDVSDKPIEWG